MSGLRMWLCYVRCCCCGGMVATMENEDVA